MFLVPRYFRWGAEACIYEVRFWRRSRSPSPLPSPQGEGDSWGCMKAVILAAGKGTRMKELTNEVPKPMLLSQGKPIIEHILEGILAAGVRDIFIVTGYRAEAIEE